ncbi:MBL fold metallo-hydrolase [Kineococcus sp. NUM-3379]
MRLTVVGCSGSVPGPGSPASCYLLEAPGVDGRTWRLLLDLGSGALGVLQRHADPASLDAVLLSHLHPDHCLDLCALHVWRRHGPPAGALPLLPVFAPAGAAERLDAAYRPAPGHGGLGASYVFGDLSDGLRLSVGPFGVTAAAVEHPVEAYGFRVEAAGRVLAYSGDTDACDGLHRLAAGADLLLAEAGSGEDEQARGVHLTGRRAGEAARAAGARRLLLTHVPPWGDGAAALAAAREEFTGPVELVVPGGGYDV